MRYSLQSGMELMQQPNNPSQNSARISKIEAQARPQTANSAQVANSDSARNLSLEQNDVRALSVDNADDGALSDEVAEIGDV